MTNTKMIRKILIPIDGSALSFDGAAGAIRLAKQLGATIAVCIVCAPYTTHFSQSLSRAEQKRSDDYEANARRSAEAAFEPITKLARDFAVEYETHLLFDLHIADAICEAAHSLRCQMICFGSHGRGAIGRLLLGSIATKVLALSKLPVTIYPVRVPSKRAIRTVS
jgi:nucleotide-binding universal stress UspA family protein